MAVVAATGLLSEPEPTWNDHFRSGDMVRMETSRGPFAFRVVKPGDPSFLEVRWDWPSPPDDSL